MNTIRYPKTGLACSLIAALGLTLAAGSYADTTPPPAPTAASSVSSNDAASSSDATVAPQTADQLAATVAPIALYPDSLVAQVLSASQFPDQIAVADYWVTQNKSLGSADFAAAVDKQSWDPSVKALTQFPSVLHDLATNLAWTSALGEAFHYQQADVMAAVQALRAKAQAAGNLKSTPQIKVVQQSPSTIVIQPATPDVVYVPQYNPTVVYGVPYVVPYYTPVYPTASAALSFGAGVAVGAAIGGFNWGFNSWGLGWGGWGGGGNTIIFNHTTYISHTTWNGSRYNWNGYHPWGPHQGPIGPGPHGGWNTHNAPGWDPHGGGWSPHGNYYPNGHGGYDWQRNGGDNGNHGLIGGNGGVQHPVTPGATRDNSVAADRNATVAAGDRGNGLGAEHDNPAQRENPAERSNPAQRNPNMERNGGADRFPGAERNPGAQRAANEHRTGWNGNGAASRAEQNRGQHAQQMHAQHMSAPHMRAPSGGGRRR